MSEALGDSLFIDPIERDGDQWTGHVLSRGAKVVKETTIYDCDLVIYDNANIVSMPKYNGKRVHNVWYQNIIKIEGVY